MEYNIWYQILYFPSVLVLDKQEILNQLGFQCLDKLNCLVLYFQIKL